jgi:serine/threonine-protein kinase RsbW
MNILKELSIASSLNNINLVQRFVEEVCDEFNINNSYFGNISVAINEAIRNAIIHGNKLDENKNVFIAFGRKNDALIFVIKDQGIGFDYHNLIDPTEEIGDNIGTGIFLINLLSDNVSFSDNGSTIEISFFVKSINQSLANERATIFGAYKCQRVVREFKKSR